MSLTNKISNFFDIRMKVDKTKYNKKEFPLYNAGDCGLGEDAVGSPQATLNASIKNVGLDMVFRF